MCPGLCKGTNRFERNPSEDSAQSLKGTMKRVLSLILIYCASTGTASPQQIDPLASNVVHVATALNHLTILEFHEPVTMAAAGSTDFQIERQENKVFIRPMKSGVSTDLFVWTASRRFAYELEITAEVKNMNFAIDTSTPATPAPSPVSPHVDEFTDITLARAFLGTEQIDNSRVRTQKEQLSVRFEQAFRTRSSVYIHYVVENNLKSHYHLSAPSAYQLRADHPSVYLPSLACTQLDNQELHKLGNAQELVLPVARAEFGVQDLGPGDATHGVVAIRQDLNSPAIVQLVFVGGFKATLVL